MAENGLVECPACGEWVTAGTICEECGAELADAKPVEAISSVTDVAPTSLSGSDRIEEMSAPEVKFDAPDPADVEEAKGLLNAAKSDLPTAAEAFDLPGHGMMPDEPDSHDHSFSDDCPHFRLEFNDATVFVQGWFTSFNFRIVPISAESGQCKMLKLEVKVPGEQAMTKTVFGLRGQRPITEDVNFRAKDLGFNISSEVRLNYYFNGQSHSYVANFKWDCVTPEESSKVIENLVIKMENVEAGMAADQNINILKDFKARQSQSLSSRLQDLKLEPIWKALELYDTSEGTAQVPKDLQSKLTLLGPGETRLHLLGGERMTMGRGRPDVCDILTYLFKGPNLPDSKLTMSNGISRFQAHVVFSSGQWELRDGGVDPSASLARVKPSSYGTYLGGERVSGAVVIDSAIRQQPVTFGKSNMREKNTFGFELTVFNDPERGGPSALLLERMDRVSESFLCVVGKVDFGEIFPNVADGVLQFSKGGFKHSSAMGEQWLMPEAPFGFGWSCQTYAQAGFETQT